MTHTSWKRARVGLFAAGLAVLLGAAWTPTVEGDATSADAFTAHWRYAGGEAGRQRVDDAVSDAVEGLVFFLRPVAEGRIEARVGPFEHLWFRQRGDRLSFTADDWGPNASSLGGPPRTIQGPGGSDVELRQRLQPDGSLVQVFRSGDASRRNRLRVTDGGRRLILHTRLSGERIETVSYRLPYRRIEDF